MNGVQHGEGVFILPNGKERKGEWENGQRIKWIDEPYLNPDNVNNQSKDYYKREQNQSNRLTDQSIPDTPNHPKEVSKDNNSYLSFGEKQRDHSFTFKS